LREYFFAIRSGGRTVEGPMVVALTGDEAALGYACELARKLRRTGGYSDPNLAIRVADQHRAIVFSIPFRAACA
jgi:hypothetical protein